MNFQYLTLINVLPLAYGQQRELESLGCSKSCRGERGRGRSKDKKGKGK